MLKLTLAFLLLASSSLAGGEQRPARATAAMHRQAGAIVHVPIDVDLTDVFVGPMPAVLGGYVARIDFDPAKVAFLRVTGGGSGAFAATPAATFAGKANENGVLKIAAAQTSRYGPIGRIPVATAVFRELEPGGASTIQVRLESAASALAGDGDGLALAVAKE